MAKEISSKETELEKVKSEMNDKISDINKQLDEKQQELDTKRKEVEDLKEELKQKTALVNKAEIYKQVIQEIKDVMLHKGFLSDKELDDILEKNELEEEL
ncbi:MAG: hypothetical protein ACTSUL_02950, partial [Promethearchaeota archaeon]